ncbi:MAG: DUF1294 domain-containing protein [Phycisphaeraceae bacterium]|nr:DUF1294 domain-containing protein [Phycisphaeraceae bacterium]MCW5755245.1 DUF1294 domain-containing protein [Phycisphaeraceae bacterium]
MRIVVVILAWYFAWSVMTFIVFAHDKRAARLERRRIREATLLKMAFAGGWPGAVAAGRLLRHKTRKAPFRRMLWAIIAVHTAVWGLVLILNRAQF